MTNEVLQNIYLNFGLIGLITISFFALVFWVINDCRKREEKYQEIIQTLAGELPEIRNTLNRIERKLEK